ncbi:MAG: efflux RND transporter periplasmic adaptor subunit [Stenotrophomonas chelatiphaga]
MKIARWMGIALGVAALAACSDKPEAPVAAVPVLVVHPLVAAGDGAMVFPGEVRARQESALSFRVAGKLLRRDVDAGQRVVKGQLLAELDPADFALQARASQAQLAAAQAELVRARDDHKRYETLAAQQLISRSALDQQAAAFKAAQGQVDAARANADVLGNQAGYAQLRAPADGVIASREPDAEAGQVVAAGQTLFTLAADDGREVRIDLPEAMLRDFPVGTAVQVEPWSRGGPMLPGTIREVAAAADPQSRTFAARVSLAADALADVSLGQSARVHGLAGGNGKTALQLPLSALQRGADDRASVWVVDPTTARLKAVPVTAGAYGSDTVPVMSGVTASDWVVAAGGHLLRAGQRVTAVDRQNRPVLKPAAAAATKAGE